MPNPFREDKGNDEQGRTGSESDRGGKENEEGSGGTGQETGGNSEETSVHPLFAKADDSGGVTSDLFVAEDDVPDDEKHTPEGSEEPLMKVKTFKKRIGAVIRQREDAKRALAEAEKAQSELAGERDGYLEVLGELREKYKENPSIAMGDAMFMDALEELTKTDPTAAKLATDIQKSLEGKIGTKGSKFTMTTPDKSTPAQAGLSKEADARLDALVQSQARSTIRDTLTGLKPAFIEILSDHIVGVADKLEGLTSADVVDFSRKYLEKKGLTQAEVMEGTKKTSDDDADSDKTKKGGKPATGGTSGSAAKKSEKKAAGDDDDKPDEPKSLAEFETMRAKRREKALREVGFTE
jgi:hypothetical protein